MASIAFAPSTAYRGLSMGEVDAVVSARLGPTRIQGNAQPACFNRQVAMYLAKHVAGWSTTLIGRYYHGRDHSTVIHGVERIEALRESDPEVDALISELKAQLEHTRDSLLEKRTPNDPVRGSNRCHLNIDELAERIAERVWVRLRLHLGSIVQAKNKQRLKIQARERPHRSAYPSQGSVSLGGIDRLCSAEEGANKAPLSSDMAPRSFL